MSRISPFGQFVAGVSVALIIYDVCYTPTARELLIALAAVSRPKLPVADRGPPIDRDFLFLRLAQSLTRYPYVSLGAAMVFTVVTLLAPRHW